ncbi:MAG: SDR family oxidoreductase [Phycisphaerales bacterium]|nr:SDR family oxidoreductase [Phycisphaerales bacterium]
MMRRPVALITGGAKRVGRATTLALARGGCDVVITFDRSESAARATIDEAIAAGASAQVCRAVRLPLDEPGEVERQIDTLASALGTLDVLVHNASSYTPTPREALRAEDALAAYRVNALAPLLISTRCAALLERSAMPGGGAIVAMCDIHAMGEHGLPRKDFLAYAMSKAALAELVRSLARELAPRVRVNGVAPGVAAWPEQGHESDAEMQAAYLKKVPLSRAGTPEECAEVVRWLALDATYITGQIVRFDGGRSMV